MELLDALSFRDSAHPSLASARAERSCAFVCWRRFAGSGKTAIVNELAAATGNQDMVRITLDDQMDAKSLLGAYVCTATPGEFVWQPGPLTKVTARPRIMRVCCVLGTLDTADLGVLVSSPMFPAASPPVRLDC